MRPLSVVSDLQEVIFQAMEEAQECGLEPDQIVSIIRKSVQDWEKEAMAAYLSDYGR